MPARRKRQNRNKKNKNNSKSRRLIILALTLFFSFLVYKLFFVSRYWTTESKLSLVVQEGSGNVSVIVFDPLLAEITRIKIPGNVEVNVSNNLGIWKIKSVWKLGETEGGSGKLLASTITKDFKFPVYLWAENQAAGFSSLDPGEIFKAALLPYRTNLSWGDRISMGIYSIRVKNVNKTEIDLTKTQFLKEKILTDGTEGYEKSGVSIPKLYLNFNDYDFSEQLIKVQIKDATGSNTISKDVGKTLEVMGAKVTSISKEEEEDIYCVVNSGNLKISKKISLIYGCKISEELKDSYSLELKLGRKFLQKY